MFRVAFVVAVVAIAAGAVGGFVWRPLWLVPAAYVAAVAVGGTAISAGKAPGVRLRVPPVLATMHIAWGLGFLASRIRLDDDLPGGEGAVVTG